MPTISELRDVLDWQAIAVVRAIDDLDGATVPELAGETDLGRGVVESRLQQLTTLGLAAEDELEGETVYDLTGRGHGAVGAGLSEGYDLVGEATVDDLAERVAALLDRRDAIHADLADLRADAETVREKAVRQFGDRDDVAAEIESLLADVDALADDVDDGDDQSS